jgi:hypothetical protein
MKRVSVQEGAEVPLKVSGLDSFADSSEKSESDGRQGEETAAPRSLYDRLQAAKLAQSKLANHRKTGSNDLSTSKDIGKHKKSRLNPKVGLEEHMRMLGQGGQDMEGVVATGCFAGDHQDTPLVTGLMKLGGGAHDTNGLASDRPDNLTGAHGEPRQEK